MTCEATARPLSSDPSVFQQLIQSQSQPRHSSKYRILPGSGEISRGASSSILAPRAAPAEAAGKEEGWGVLLGSGAAAEVQRDKGAGQQWDPAPNAAQVRS